MTDLASSSNLESYKALIDKFNKLDIVTKELTLFNVGARGHFENPTTELLSFFLDSNKPHELEDCFFNGLQKVIAGKNICSSLGRLLNVETEVSTAKGNRIDLLLETEKALIIIECKIYHNQNNPFDDYTSYGNSRKQTNEHDKTLIQLVLCLDGKVSPALMQNNWHGISYQELVVAIEPHLSNALLDNPYNKWGLFAREFLLHLKELDNVGEMSKDETNFLTENINDYFKLSEYLYENIIPKIAAKIELELNDKLEGIYSKSKIKKWYSYEPYISFSNKKWENSSSCVVLCIRNYKANEMNFTIHIDFFNENGILKDQADSLLKHCEIDIETYENKSDGNNTWRFMWKYNDFEIKKVSERIVELMTVLNDYEANKYELNY